MKTKMSFNEFKEQLTQDLESCFGFGTVAVNPTVKDNRELTEIRLMTGQKIAPQIYMEYMYMLLNSYSYDYVVDKAVRLLTGQESDHGFDVDNMSAKMKSKDFILSKVTFKMVNKFLNGKLAEGRPHREVLDFLVLYKVNLSEFSNGGTDGQMAFVTLDNNVIESNGITEQELYDAALRNTEAESTVTNLRDMLRRMYERAGMPEFMIDQMLEESPEEMPDLYVISNKDSLGGAAGILSAKILEETRGMAGADKLVIFPSSRHEAIAMAAPEGFKAEGTINTNEVTEEDYLSDNVYTWDGYNLSFAY